MFRRSEPCHILHDAEHRHVDLRALKHADALARVGECHFLRSGDHYGSGDGKGLHKRQMDVARSWGHVYHKIVEVAPIGVADELLQGVACHAAAPKHGVVFVYEEAYRQHFYAILLYGCDKVAAAYLIHIHGGILYSKHLWSRRSEDVGVKQPHLVALLGKRHGKIACHGGFAYSAFARRDSDDVFHSGEHLGGLLYVLAVLHADVALYAGILAGISLDGCFSGLDNTFDKRIGRFVKNQRERHVHSVNADVVLNHIVLHKVFAVAWVADVAQSLGD